MDIKGYMIEGTWDGQFLTVRGTNKASHYALVGPDMEHAKRVHADAAATTVRETMGKASGLLPDGSAVAIHRDDMSSVEFKRAGLMTNGRLTVHTTSGRKYELHFLRKHAATFDALAAELS